MDTSKKFTLTLLLWVLTCTCIKAQDSLRYLIFKHYKETALTVGYNYNFGDKVDGERPPAVHFFELGLWRSHVSTGHHPVAATYYVANDFGLNTNDFVIGPKVGGFISVMILGLGGELCYYTDFESGSLKFIPSMGLFTPYFKLTINPCLTLTNKDFQDLNKAHVNLTIRAFGLRRKDLK